MMMWRKIYSVLALTTSVASAQTGLSAWEAGLVLDTALSSSKPELAARDQGAGLGHSDVLLRGPLGPWFSAEVIGSFHTVDQKLETHWENAWVQTRGLPAGWQVRAGRFASQVGYWNEIHPHADDFAERGLLQRAFLGGHWVDDGVRVNWTAPTDFYLRLGMESMSGRRWLPESTSGGRVNTYSLKIGHDWGAEHSWQWGLAWINNRRDPLPEVHSEAEHSHAHGARFVGRDFWLSDLVWKWAPDGNPQQRQIRLVWEWAQARRALPEAGWANGHSAHSLGLVWRFERAWETGVRHDRLQVHARTLHEGEWEMNPGQLRESSVMLAHKPSHRQTWRLQVAHQTASNPGEQPVFANPARRSVVLQYILSFGAHGAHSY